MLQMQFFTVPNFQPRTQIRVEYVLTRFGALEFGSVVDDMSRPVKLPQSYALFATLELQKATTTKPTPFPIPQEPTLRAYKVGYIFRAYIVSIQEGIYIASLYCEHTRWDIYCEPLLRAYKVGYVLRAYIASIQGGSKSGFSFTGWSAKYKKVCQK
jgi:hypothetical protein